MLHGFDFTKIVMLSILIDKIILRIQIPMILSSFNTRVLYFRCAAHTQSNW